MALHQKLLMMRMKRMYNPNVQHYGGPMVNARAMFEAQQAGDFLGIGKALKKFGGFIPGIGGILQTVGGVVEGVGGKKKGKRSKTAGPAGPSGGGSSMMQTTVMPGSGVSTAGFGLPSFADIQRMLTPQYTNPLAGSGVSTAGMVPGHSDIARTLGVGSVANIPKGYRLNKSKYYIDDPLIPGSEQGREIEPGTRIVKIRRRNPFNPRAASRAMSRLSALHHGMRALEKNLRKLAPPARHRLAAAPGRKK